MTINIFKALSIIAGNIGLFLSIKLLINNNKRKKEKINNFCTMYICKFESNFDSNQWLKELYSINPVLFEKIKNGDLLENVNESGYRSNGVYIFNKIKNKLIILSLSKYPDDYGSIPEIFEVITEFKNPYYWHNENNYINHVDFTNSNLCCESCWHNNYVPINLDKIKVENINEDDYLYLLNNTETFLHDYSIHNRIKEYYFIDYYLKYYKINFKNLTYFIKSIYVDNINLMTQKGIIYLSCSEEIFLKNN